MKLHFDQTIEGFGCFCNHRLVCWVANNYFRVIPDRSHTLVKILYYRYARTRVVSNEKATLKLITSLVLL